jgi:hypothetical protein
MKIVVLVALLIGAMTVAVYCVRELWGMRGRAYVFPPREEDRPDRASKEKP